MVDKSKYIEMFVEEAQEHLQILNQALLDLEKNGYDKEQLNSAYRVVHTIKGSASVLGIDGIGDLAHTMEDLFDRLREEEEILNSDVLDTLFRSSDSIENMVQELADEGKVTTDCSDVIKEMKAFTPKTKHTGPSKKKVNKRQNQPSFEFTSEHKNQVIEALSNGNNVLEVIVTIGEKCRFKEGRVLQLINKLSPFGSVIASSPETKDIDDTIEDVKLLFATKEKEKQVKKMTEGITGLTGTTIAPLDIGWMANEKKVDNEKDENKVNDSKQQTGLAKGDTIRVKSKLLDKLLDLVGEIMISNIRVNQIATDLKNRELKQVLKNNERLTSELQDIVLRMRMVPVDHIFKRFPRMVRDMARGEGKKINFEIVGHDIEIDRSLLGEIGDSLVHLLRNAVDHGIESDEERKTKLKKSNGFIKLSAAREQSNIVITVEDDGRGLDIKKIVDKALQTGAATEEEIDNFDRKEMLQLAFCPGVSTASKITEISGRGVGLDVVKSKIEELGGIAKLESDDGIGTKFTMKLPPSMSIIGAMLVVVNNENYAIPLENVSETTKVSIEEIHEFAKSGVFRLREEVLPLLNVHSEFGGSMEQVEGDLPVIIVEKDDSRAGLIVTKFIGQQEIVVKTLNKDMRQAQFFSGATILGDGNVALILDVGALI
jgi:two-component system chemotaxis sensor kinase CheA